MQKKSKKLVAFLLSILVIVSLIPTTGLTVGAATQPKLAKKSLSVVIGGTAKIKVKNAPKGAKITYKSAKSSIATVSKQGKVKGIKNGTAKITVTVKKNSKTTNLACKVNVKEPKLSKRNLSVILGKKAKISIDNEPKKAKFTWKSSNSKVAKVSKTGKVTAKKIGKANIKVAVKTQKKTYNLSCKVSVVKGYTVKFNSNGGSAVASQTVKKNGLSKKPADPVRTGYVFDGWYTDNGTFKNKFKFSTHITKNITLYAKWKTNIDGVSSGSDNSVSVYAISALSVDNESNTVKATVSAPENCALIVRFVEEDVYFSDSFKQSKKYINNGDTFASHVVAGGSNMMQINAGINYSLPECFVAEAILIDENQQPLCEPYSSIENTKRYKEFDSKTVYDFAQDNLVLNFDPAANDNFGVLADDVRVLTAEDVVIKDDDGDGFTDRYQIFKPSSTINNNDKIFISDDDGEDYMFKVLAITTENGYSIVVPAKADDEQYGFSVEDFYKYMKVDMEYNDGETTQTQQPRTIASGARRGINVKSVYENDSKEVALTFSPFNFETKHFRATAKCQGKVSASLVIQWDIVIFGKDYLRCDFTFSTETTTDVEVVGKWGNADKNEQLLEKEKETRELKLGKLRIPFGIIGLDAFADIKICVEWEITAGLNAKVVSSTKSGFKYNTIDGYQKIDEKENDWSVQCLGHAEVKFGPKPSVGVEFLDGALSCGVECFFGAVIEADAVVPGPQGGDSIHACHLCIEGNLDLCISVDVVLKYKLTDFFKGTPIDLNIAKINKHLFDFYLSLSNDRNSKFGGEIKAGTGSCENRSYKTTIYAKDSQGRNVSTDIDIYKKDNNQHIKKIGAGSSLYLYSTDYVAKAIIDGVACEKAFKVADSVKVVTISSSGDDSSVNGSVIDVLTGEAIQGARINVYDNTTLVANATSDDSGTFSVALDQGNYMIEVSKSGYITATQYFSISDGEKKYIEAFKLVKQNSSEIMGGIFGTIKDAMTGDTVSGVDIKISRGWGNDTDDNIEYVAEENTNSSGKYSIRKNSVYGVNFGLDAGNYTVSISKDGYIPTSFNITIVGGEDMEFNSSITPVGAEDMYHIVLTWGQDPLDLDSHLNATCDDYREHVYFADEYGYYSELDVDDTDSYGPETITIEDITKYTGDVMYSVHDYTNREETNSTAFSTSSATVKVYRGGQLLETFHVPTGVRGNVWNVFYIDSEHNIHPVNTFEDIYEPSDVYGSN